jgi:integrase
MVEETHAYRNNYNKKGIRNTRGGTHITNASNLSFIIRLAHKRSGFGSLCDNDIENWILELKDEYKDSSHRHKKRSSRQVRKIVHKGLNFLLWYQSNYLPEDKLIGFKKDCRIRIEKKSGQATKSGFKFDYISHRYLIIEDTPRDIKPISGKNITELYNCIRKVTNNKFVIKRDENILRMLEATGGRRIEVRDLKVEDIYAAKQTGYITLESSKSNIGQRKIPIAEEWINPVIVYIRSTRQKLINKLLKEKKILKDNGALFVSLTTGRPLSEETITKMISRLRRFSNIDEKACAHMFRHRFITIQVATRLKSYQRETLPMDISHTILTKVATLTGHTNPLSLHHYIDLAFDELGLWDTSEKVLGMRSVLEGSYRSIQSIRNDMLSSKITTQSAAESIEELLKSLLETITEDNLDQIDTA